MKVVCPKCGSCWLWLSDDWVSTSFTDGGVELMNAGIACECQDCRAVFEVHATGFEVKVESP